MNSRHVLVKHLFAIDDRSYLQQIERACPVGIDITCELYFHWSFHISCPESLCHLQQFGKWKHALLEYSTEGDNLTSAFVDAIADYLVIRIIGRSYIVERAVLVGFLHAQVKYVETI